MAKKKKATEDLAEQTANEAKKKRFVLVGTYKGDQLTRWPGWYNYPISEKDDIGEANAAKINELWLFKGTKDQRTYKAEFVGVKTRQELIDVYGYPAAGKAHGERYLLFKTTVAYATLSESPDDSFGRVFVRLSDFSRSPNVRNQLKEYLESPNRQDRAFASSLPAIITRVPRDVLCVCEFAVQMEFISRIYPNQTLPLLPPLAYSPGKINVGKGVLGIAPRCFRMGEFFCGPGGLACGALSAKIEIDGFRIEHAWANDYDEKTCETYRENICRDEPETVICGDVRKLDLNDNRLTPIDGFSFGFPCNDFSLVGERKGVEGNFGPLYQYGVAVLRKFQPIWFVAENVGGLASANEGAAFRKILESMKSAGYRIYPHLYKFEEYGVPQARHRIIIVGIRRDQKCVFYPPAPWLLVKRDNSARAALEKPPIPLNAPNNDLTAQHPTVVERLKYIRPGENAFTANLPKHLQLNVKGAKISQIYKRLDPSRPAYTVTGSGGGGTHIYHYSEPRALTNRERARLQTFPDQYLFCGSKESVRKQIGMAVPPRGAQIIFEALLRSYAGIEYEHVECNISEEGDLK